MQRKIRIVLAITLGFMGFGLLFSCTQMHSIEGNSNIEYKIITVNSFNALASEGEFDVYYTQDSIYGVRIEAESNLLPYIFVHIDGHTLVIETKNDRNLEPNYPMKVYVSSPHIKKMALAGSGNIFGTNIIETELEIDLIGSGNIETGVQADFVEVDVSGSGNVELWGNTTESDITINGSGDIDAYSMAQDTCFAKIVGSGNIYVRVHEFLDVQIKGSGNVYYKGSPIVNLSITGSGNVFNED